MKFSLGEEVMGGGGIKMNRMKEDQWGGCRSRQLQPGTWSLLLYQKGGE